MTICFKAHTNNECPSPQPDLLVHSKGKCLVGKIGWMFPYEVRINQGGISSSVLSVFFTDNCYKLLKSLHLIGWEQICQWKTLTKRLMKCPPGNLPLVLLVLETMVLMGLSSECQCESVNIMEICIKAYLIVPLNSIRKKILIFRKCRKSSENTIKSSCNCFEWHIVMQYCPVTNYHNVHNLWQSVRGEFENFCVWVIFWKWKHFGANC